jgi:hypothetical protein
VRLAQILLLPSSLNCKRFGKEIDNLRPREEAA